MVNISTLYQMTDDGNLNWEVGMRKSEKVDLLSILTMYLTFYAQLDPLLSGLIYQQSEIEKPASRNP